MHNTISLFFSYFTEFVSPPDGMMCTNVSKWSDVYWTPEDVTVCACEIVTNVTNVMEEVHTLITVKLRVLTHLV